ncbi:hypothetical protein Y919_09420 [Caloranaerobacter azorensis H53214]|uniref:Uncharacterized protein n=1 Tax=Caloranaerobacter azorensis H53214 TaxID=1156417 RepID=A0A096DKR4_9FIRM|nr:hypothetical protein [Caloranaerobacter azorensis]KGG79881.1 hypothetical protein Y919_09420 [Caloranaerobacter azorensis H53214]
MSEIGYKLYKNLEDDVLLKEAYSKMEKLRFLSSLNNEEMYWEEANEFNELIIEIKRRNITINKEMWIKKIIIDI